MSHYTDDDVQAASAAVEKAQWEGFMAAQTHQQISAPNLRYAKAVLDAVAPAIAARALREASEAVLRNEKPCNVQRSCHLADSITLTERADEIERGAL